MARAMKRAAFTRHLLEKRLESGVQQEPARKKMILFIASVSYDRKNRVPFVRGKTVGFICFDFLSISAAAIAPKFSGAPERNCCNF